MNIHKAGIISLLFLFTLCGQLFAQDYKSEKQLIKGANDLFDKGDFKAAIPLYSTLVSNYPKDPEYNFKYGASLLYGESDKEKPIKYLQYAVSKPDVDPLAYYYYGVALHLNYEFKKAIKYYKKFQNLGKPADTKRLDVEDHITQCENGTSLLKTITDLIVLDKKELRDQDFYKVYDLTQFGGQILVKPDDFLSDYEKKNAVKGIFFFPKDADKIFFSRQNSEEGSKDIYYKLRNPDGSWSKSISMGKPINTKSDEDFPFMHPDGQTLYFASKGHNSLGGYDIFVSRMDDQGNWTQPKNLDFAINTPADDYLFITDMAGETAYFSSNRETPQGEVTVYQINMERIPLDFAFVYGTFESENTKKAKIKVVDAETQAIIGDYETDDNGKYKIKLPNDGTFEFIVDFEGSKVAHSGTVEIQERDAFKPLKQTMKVTDPGTDDEKLVIKNLVDEEVEEDVELTADFLKKRAKLEVNKDKVKRPKKKPELIAEETSGSQASATPGQSNETSTASPDGRVSAQDAGKAGTSISSEENIQAPVNTEGPQLAEETSGNDGTSGNQNNNEKSSSSVGNNNSNSGSSSAGSSANVSGGAQSAGAALAVGGAVGAAILPTKIENPSQASKNDLVAATQDHAKALDNDQQIYTKQAEIGRKQGSSYAVEAADKKQQAQNIMSSASPGSDEYKKAQAMEFESELLERKAKTSDEVVAKLEKNSQTSEDLERLAQTYDSQISNQTDDAAGQTAYQEYESKLNSSLESQSNLGELQTQYENVYTELAAEAGNERGIANAMQEEIEEIEAEIESKETELSNAKGKTKSELETQIASNKSDLEAEKSHLNEQLNKASSLEKQAAFAKMDLDAVNEIIQESGKDETIQSLSSESSFALTQDQAKPVEELSSVEELSASVYSGQGFSEASISSSSLASDNTSNEVTSNAELASNTGVESNNNELGEENLPNASSNGNENAGQPQTIQSTSYSGDDAGTNETGEVSANASKNESSNPGTQSTNLSPKPVNSSQAGMAVGSAVAASAASWDKNNVPANETLEVYPDEDELTEDELALIPDSTSTQVSAFTPELANEEIVNPDQNIRSVIGRGYNQEYNSQFLNLIEDEGSEYDKAVKTYAINESWLLDIDRELDYLNTIADEVPEEYQANLDQRMAALESLKEQRFSNMESSKERVLSMSGSEGTSEDLQTKTNEARADLMASLSGAEDESAEESGGRANQAAMSEGDSNAQPSNELAANQSTANGDEGTSQNDSSVDNETSINNSQTESQGDQTANSNADGGDFFGATESPSAAGTAGVAAAASAAGQVATNSNSDNTGSNESGVNEADGGTSESSNVGDDNASVSTENPNNNALNSSDTDQESQYSIQNGSSSQEGEKDDFFGYNASEEDNNTSANQTNGSADNAVADGNASMEGDIGEKPNNTDDGGSQFTQMANSATQTSQNPSLGEEGENKTSVKPNASSDKLALVFATDAAKSIDEVVGAKTTEAESQKETISAEVTDLEAVVNENEAELASAKRKRRKQLEPELEQQKRDLANAQNEQEIAEHRSEALARAADVILVLDEGEEKESEKELKRAETLKVEAEEVFGEADNKESEKVKGKKKKRAQVAEVKDLRDEAERILAQASASEQLAVELQELEDEVLSTYKNTPEELPRSTKRLSNADVEIIRSSQEFQQYDKQRREASVFYQQAQEAYFEAEKLEKQNTDLRSEITELSASLNEETDVDAMNDLTAQIEEKEALVQENESKIEDFKSQSKELYTEYNHKNNEAIRYLKSLDPSIQENQIAYANELERTGEYAVAPIPGSSLASLGSDKGYSPDQFSRVVKGIDDYPNELKDAIFDMIDFNKSLYNEENPVPVDTKLPGGVIFKVQIGAFRNPPPDDVFKGFAPVRGENTRPGWVRYTAGLFTSRDQAKLKRNEIRAIGYKDAFVVAYKDGKRISLQEADQLIAEGYRPPTASQSETTLGGTSSSGSSVQAGVVLDVNEVKGLMYTVQVGAFRNRVTSGELFGITPLVEYQQGSLYKYGSGVYNDKAKAEAAKERVLQVGVSDAFVTAFYNGKRVSMSEAAQIAQQGSQVFAQESEISINPVSSNSGNIVFRVQVGAYEQEVPVEDAKIILSLSNLGLDVQKTATMTTYTVGRYSTYNDANQVKDRVIGQGLDGAFIVAYQNDKRIEVQEAIRILGR